MIDQITHAPQVGTDARARVLVGLDEHVAHAPAIEELLARTSAPATARWGPLMTWLRHNPKCTPWSILSWRDDALVGAALLARSRSGVAYRFTTMGESHLPSWLPAVDAQSAVEVADTLAAELKAFHVPWVLHLYSLEINDPTAVALATRLDQPRTEVSSVAPRLMFAPDTTLNNYLSRNTRSSVAKARNRIRKAHVAFDLLWTRNEAAIIATIPEIVDLYRRRNLQLNQNVGLLEDPDYRAFYIDMMRSYATDGQMRLLTLRLNGELAAYAMCLSSVGTLFVYSNRISPEWDRYSPGLIANAEVVRSAFTDPDIAGVDWGSGIQRYKVSGDAVLHPYQSLHAWSGRLSFYTATSIRRAVQLARPAG